MERETHLLTPDEPLTAEEARRQTFPTVMRGLDRAAVEDFQQRTANQLYDREQEVAQLTEQLQKLQAQLDGQPDTGHSGVDVLTMATRQADAIIEDAQTEARAIIEQAEQRRDDLLREAEREAGGTVGKARQQAGSIIGRATQEAEREAARIRHEAPAEAQRITAHYVELAAAVRRGLIEDLNGLSAKLRDWSEQAQEGPVPGS